MKIAKIDDERILFDNGNEITFYHDAFCYEENYALFNEIDEPALQYDFKGNLTFESIGRVGFRFGDNPSRMFFVPCYSRQEGYYSGDYPNDINIQYNGNDVLNCGCIVKCYD